MLRFLCSSIILLFLIASMSIAETQENYLAALQELEEAKFLCEVISADENMYDAFHYQMAVVNIKFTSLEPTTYLSSSQEIALYSNFNNCVTHFLMVDLYWGFLFLFDDPDQETIDGYVGDAEEERSLAILYLDASWESYNKMDFDGDNSDDGGDGGSGGGGLCFISSIR